MPWPGIQNAEYELLRRFLVSVSALPDIEMDIIDDNGVLLDKETIDYPKNGAKTVINPKTIDFVLSLHYQTCKSVDAFWYTANWNPPEFMLRDPSYLALADNYLSSDDFLLYDSKGMNAYLETLLFRDKRSDKDYLANTLTFLPSTPELGLHAERREDRTLFYCGINWEKCAGAKGRHQTVFKLLDKTGYLRLYGPEKFLDTKPWKGYKSYQHPLPFDGVSLIREIHKCGVALLLSSDAHRRSGAASSRLYEACAAGAVILSDDNAFVRKHFSDCALFIQYDKKDPEATFAQIDEKMKWIAAHPDEAYAMAKRAQSIWRERMTLDFQIRNLCERHQERVALLKNYFYARNEASPIDIVLLWPENTLEKFGETLSNIQRQSYALFNVHIVCDEALALDAQKTAEKLLNGHAVLAHPAPVFYKRNRVMTRGQMFLSAKDALTASHFIFLEPGETWFKDHLTTLKRALEDTPDALAAQANGFKKDNGSIGKGFFQNIYRRNALKAIRETAPGAFLFDKSLIGKIPACVFENLDGLEAQAFLLESLLSDSLTASGRLTFGSDASSAVPLKLVLPLEQTNILLSFYRSTPLEPWLDPAMSSSQTDFFTNALAVERMLSRLVYSLFNRQSHIARFIRRIYLFLKSRSEPTS